MVAARPSDVVGGEGRQLVGFRIVQVANFATCSAAVKTQAQSLRLRGCCAGGRGGGSSRQIVACCTLRSVAAPRHGVGGERGRQVGADVAGTQDINR
jgi:hypothetical protein